MSIRAMNWAMAQKVGGPRAKVILMAYADFADENGVSWPALSLIASITEQSKTTVRRYLKELEGIGAISRRERTREDGSQTSDEVTLRLELSINVSAADEPHDEETGGVSLTPPASGSADPPCQIGTPPCQPDTPPSHSSHPGASTAGTPGVPLRAPPYEPSLEPPREPSPPNPPSGGDGPALRVVEVKVPPAFDAFFDAYPGSKAMDKRRAAGEFAKLTPEKQIKAVKAAPLLAAELERLKRKPKDAHKWLALEGFEQFEVDKPKPPDKPAFVFVACDSEQGRAWDVFFTVVRAAHRSPRWSEEHRAKGWTLREEWPPFGRGCPTDQAQWVWVDHGSRQWWAWAERCTKAGFPAPSAEELLGPMVMETVDGKPQPKMEPGTMRPLREWRKLGRKFPGDADGWPPRKAQCTGEGDDGPPLTEDDIKHFATA